MGKVFSSTHPVLNCISSIGDLLWSSALTLAMAVKEVGTSQSGAESKGKATQEHQENVVIRQPVPSRQQSRLQAG
jgi:hypothetical protein